MNLENILKLSPSPWTSLHKLELLTPSDDLSSAPCGHIFHSCCIIQWLETGKSSCPQCRSKCYEKQLRRVYFTEAANITLDTQSNVNTLQDRLDSLTFQLRCSESNLKTAIEDKEKSIAWSLIYIGNLNINRMYIGNLFTLSHTSTLATDWKI